VTIFQVADEPFVSMGTVHTAGTDLEVHRYTAQGAYRKLVFNRGGTRLEGAVFIGDISNAGLYRYMIREKSSFSGSVTDVRRCSEL
jgi:NAD(P)H-nitrite reductase large subunit